MCTLTEPRQKALSEGSGAPHCWLPAPPSLLTLMSGPPPSSPPTLPPSTLRRIHQGSDIGTEAAAAKGEAEGADRFPGSDAGDADTALRDGSNISSSGPETSLTWAGSFEESQGRGWGATQPAVKDPPPLATLGSAALLSTKIARHGYAPGAPQGPGEKRTP